MPILASLGVNPIKLAFHIGSAKCSYTRSPIIRRGTAKEDIEAAFLDSPSEYLAGRFGGVGAAWIGGI